MTPTREQIIEGRDEALQPDPKVADAVLGDERP